MHLVMSRSYLQPPHTCLVSADTRSPWAATLAAAVTERERAQRLAPQCRPAIAQAHTSLQSLEHSTLWQALAVMLTAEERWCCQPSRHTNSPGRVVARTQQRASLSKLTEWSVWSHLRAPLPQSRWPGPGRPAGPQVHKSAQAPGRQGAPPSLCHSACPSHSRES